MTTGKGRGGRPHRLIWNNDGSFMWYLEPSMGVEALASEVLNRWVLNTNVDTLIVRIDRGNLVPLYDSEVEGKLGKGHTVWKNPAVWRNVMLFRTQLDQGVDPWKIVFERARRAGVAAFAGIRMNDAHHTTTKRGDSGFEYTFVSDIAKKEEYFIGEDCPPPGPMNGPYQNLGHLLDFKHAEVREHRYAIVSELAERYDLDGVELDLMRHGIFFKQSEARQNAPLMTELLARIRKKFDEIERRRGHQVSLLVRVPSWFERCAEIGFDVRTWVREGLVDIIAPTALTNAEFDAPIEPFIDLAKGTPCEVTPCFEFLMPEPYRFFTPEMARAGGAWYYNQGADGIYLFNGHFFVMPFADMSAGHVQVRHPHEYTSLLGELHDPEILRCRSKRYVVSRPTTRKWTTFEKQLPRELPRVEPRATHRVIVKAADDVELGTRLGMLEDVSLLLRIGNATERDVLGVTFNGHELSRDRRRRVLQGRIGLGSGSHLYQYALDPRWLKIGENAVEVRLVEVNPATTASMELTDVEIAVNYRDVPIGV